MKEYLQLGDPTHGKANDEVKVPIWHFRLRKGQICKEGVDVKEA